jgi:methyl-accepting chemotaxis protein
VSVQVAKASHQLARGDGELGAAAQEASSSLEEITSMVLLTANNAAKAKSLAAEASHAAVDGTSI